MRNWVVTVTIFAGAVLYDAPAWACATCFGAKDDPQTEGMNMAILTLMGITYTLFLGMIGAAVVIWRKNRDTGPAQPAETRVSPEGGADLETTNV